MQEIFLEADDLAAELSELTGSGRVPASYASGPSVEKYGAPHLLSIALINSKFNRCSSDEVGALAEHLAAAGCAWLGRNALVKPSTMISIQLARETDLLLVS